MRISFTALTVPILASTVLALPKPGASVPRGTSVDRGTQDTLAARIASNNLAAPREDRGLQIRAVQARNIVARALGTGAIVNSSSNANVVRALQYLVTARGHATTVDGGLGPNTAAAVSAFQSAAGLDADGIAGPVTLGALVENVQSGSKGDVVKAAQSALNGNGATLDVDGDFGPGTHGAAVTFQAGKGLDQDGIIGPATWTALFGGSSGGGGSPPPVNPPPTAGNCDAVTSGAPADQTVVAANGIKVHQCLGATIDKMVAAAAAAGITLTAESAWRDPQEQIQLRIQNCGGDSHFNIYERDSGECTPRTAIPGSSRHERGLAVDFSNCDWGSPNFSWLSANAGNYHLYLLNTNDEPWHWSWDGN